MNNIWQSEKAAGYNIVTVIIDSDEVVPSASAVVDYVSDLGGGDMLSIVFDPTNIASDVFDMANMYESATNKIFTLTERNKLTNIEANANNYTHPVNHTADIITQDENNRFVTDTQITTWNNKQNALVSATNIKTINNVSILGSGNIPIIENIPETTETIKTKLGVVNTNSDGYLIYQDWNTFNNKKNLHGVESAGTISATRSGDGTVQSPYAYSIAISSINYWYQGVQYINTNPVSVDLATALGAALIANKLYYIYFNNSTGILAAGTSMNLKTLVLVSMVYTNSDISAVTITKETHSHTRNLDWHINAHRTIGTRYYNGLDLVAPTTTDDDTLNLTTGIIYDEDIAITITNPSTSRIWYQISSGVYTWTDSSLPYAGSTNDPTYLDIDTFTLQSVANNNFVCEWIYATNDIDRPIYIIPTQAATAHSTITSARNELQPILSGLIQELAPEWKLIYRFIYKGDGEFQEALDYRKVSSLPSGATAAIAASSVTFIPSGNITSTNVQNAIAELEARITALENQ